jgi:hypothetical protein
MAVFAIPRREQLCREAVIEFDRHLKPRSDCDLQTARARSRSFQQAYGGRIALHGTDVATAERRNTAPIATNGRGSPQTRALAKRGLRKASLRVHVPAQVIYTMPAREALNSFVEPWSISGRPRFSRNSRIRSEAIGPANSAIRPGDILADVD